MQGVSKEPKIVLSKCTQYCLQKSHKHVRHHLKSFKRLFKNLCCYFTEGHKFFPHGLRRLQRVILRHLACRCHCILKYAMTPTGNGVKHRVLYTVVLPSTAESTVQSWPVKTLAGERRGSALSHSELLSYSRGLCKLETAIWTTIISIWKPALTIDRLVKAGLFLCQHMGAERYASTWLLTWRPGSEMFSCAGVCSAVCILTLLTHLINSSVSPCVCASLSLFVLGKKKESVMFHVNEGVKGTKGWLSFHSLSVSLWPLPPEHCISRSQGSSGSKNNGEETGKTCCHLHLMFDKHSMACDTFG